MKFVLSLVFINLTSWGIATLGARGRSIHPRVHVNRLGSGTFNLGTLEELVELGHS